MEIDHAQVWTALQLIHCETLGEYREAAILRAGDEDQLLIYVPRFRRGDAGRVAESGEGEPRGDRLLLAAGVDSPAVAG